jgi:TonB family protein
MVRGSLRWRVRLLGAAAAVLMTGAAPSAHAQEVPIAKLARDAARSLEAANRHAVVVFDFYGADFPAGADPMAALGQKLAADFRAALAQAGGASLKVEDRATTVERLTTMDLSAGNLRDPNTVRWVYAKTREDAYVTGTIAKAAQGYTLAVTVHALDRTVAVNQKIGALQLAGTFSATIPALADLNALVSDPPRDEFASVPRGGANGYTKAECVRCDPPQYVDTAVRASAEGTVILAVTITSRGHVKDIRVKQGMPYGLTERAIEAVRDWKLSPAKNENGKRVAVRQDLTISFALGGSGDATAKVTVHADARTSHDPRDGAAK